jgi:hypothetical protein
MTLENESIWTGMPGAEKITGIAGDAPIEHERSTRVSMNECGNFPLRLMLRKLEHGTALKADSTAIARFLLKKPETGFHLHNTDLLHCFSAGHSHTRFITEKGTFQGRSSETGSHFAGHRFHGKPVCRDKPKRLSPRMCGHNSPRCEVGVGMDLGAEKPCRPLLRKVNPSPIDAYFKHPFFVI